MFNETGGKGQFETATSIKEKTNELKSKIVYFNISGIDNNTQFLFNEV